MTIDRYTKILMTVFTIALLLNGLNPWTQPPDASAKENAAISGDNKDTDCSLATESSTKTLKAVNDMKRLVGYIESTVNGIKLTVNGIDRKVNTLTVSHSTDSADRRN